MTRRQKPKADPKDLERLERSQQKAEQLWTRLIRTVHALEKERARARRLSRKITKQLELPPATEAIPPNGTSR